MGRIIIGPGGTKATVVPDDAERAGISYAVVLSGQGQTIRKEFGPEGGKIELAEGRYQITVRAMNAEGRLRGFKEEIVQVVPGFPREIVLSSVIGIKSAAELAAAFSGSFLDGRNYIGASDETNVLVIENSFTDSRSSQISLAANYTIIVETGKILTIQRGSCTDSLFDTNGKDLVLGSTASGYTGEIVVDGNNISLGGDSPLVTVNNGSLTMYFGVTLKNNDTNASGNGGAVKVATGGLFYLKGGTIGPDNKAVNGGGVRLEGGAFYMERGTITGNSANGTPGGGGVNINIGTFEMSGGTIEQNRSDNGGGYL